MSNRRAGFVAMLVAIDAGLVVQPLAAQQPPGMVAYDYCHSWGDQGLCCGVFVVAGDGSTGSTSVMASTAVWSTDGSRLAFDGDRRVSEPSLSVLNLADWSVARLPGSTHVPERRLPRLVSGWRDHRLRVR